MEYSRSVIQGWWHTWIEYMEGGKLEEMSFTGLFHYGDRPPRLGYDPENVPFWGQSEDLKTQIKTIQDHMVTWSFRSGTNWTFRGVPDIFKWFNIILNCSQYLSGPALRNPLQT